MTIQNVFSKIKLSQYEAQYDELPGWKEDITNVKSFDELPITAQDYIHYIEKYLGIEVYLVSVGPERSQNIIRTTLF